MNKKWWGWLPWIRKREEKRKSVVRLFLTGFAMGSADIVPGVSGGTMALILGVYEELIYSVKVSTGKALKRVVRGDVGGAIEVVPLEFVVPLGLGIMAAVLFLSKGISWALENSPEMVWGFFFGLVCASIWVVSKTVRKWGVGKWLGLVAASVGAYAVVGLVPVETPANPAAFFLAGMVAIVAMILPGVSGSFLLVLLGKYGQILEAVNNKDLMILGLVVMGAVLGLGLFSRVLSWLFEHYHDLAISVLVGFMIGSLRKIWPWKEVVEYYSDSHGELVPLVEKNLMPSLNGELGLVMVVMVVGFGLILYLDRIRATEEHVEDVGKEYSKKHKQALLNEKRNK